MSVNQRWLVNTAVALGPPPAQAELHERVVEAHVGEAHDHRALGGQDLAHPGEDGVGIRDVLEHVRADRAIEALAAQRAEPGDGVVANDAIQPRLGFPGEIGVDLDAHDGRAQAGLDLGAERPVRAADVEHARRLGGQQGREIRAR